MVDYAKSIPMLIWILFCVMIGIFIDQEFDLDFSIGSFLYGFGAAIIFLSIWLEYLGVNL